MAYNERIQLKSSLIEAGCPTISNPDNGKITYLNSKASAMLFCEPNYEIVGSSYAHCNGSSWDRNVGRCQETDNQPSTTCDFETESICGWSHAEDEDFGISARKIFEKINEVRKISDFERRSGYNNKTVCLVR